MTHTSALASDWNRAQWVAYADTLLDGARAHLSTNGSQILFPGPEGGYGQAVDGLEGFTRTLLIAGFRIAGERGQGVDELIEFCLRGIAAGVDPDGADRWVLLTEHAQAKVEAASIALVLDLTRPWVWNRLSEITQERVIGYLSPVVGDDSYPKTNWLWFRIVVQTFLRSVGGPWSSADITADLALHDSLVRADGWISDGVERSYDHYVGWALHLYPVLWSRMQGAGEFAAGRTASDIDLLDRYLQDAVALVGADGSPLIQGRSLIYRFAAAAAFWVGVIAEVPSTSPGLLRHAATRVVRHFEAHGVPDDSGVLSLGWHDEWRALAQSYSGPGSPYWAAKGLLGIMLPADHPVWAAPARDLPVEESDTLRAISAPGWIVSGTRSDGIVRVVNHGSDHAVEGISSADSPLYARLGYSTATTPLLDDESWSSPLDQTVALLDSRGRATHRAGMHLLGAVVRAGVGISGSTWEAHWLEPELSQQRHGSGLPGRSVAAGQLTVLSLVRGPWELRLVRLDSIEPDSAVTGLRVGGWAVAGDAPTSRIDTASAAATAGALTSSLHGLRGDGEPGVIRRRDASPLGSESAVPVIEYSATVGDWKAALVELGGSADTSQPFLALTEHEENLSVNIVWPDGVDTTTELIDLRSAVKADRHPDRAQ